jgi:hypothetical protein
MCVPDQNEAPPKGSTFIVGETEPIHKPTGMGSIGVNPAAGKQYEQRRTPSSDGKGEIYYTSYDRDTDTNYMYDKITSRRATTKQERNVNTALGQRKGIYAGYDFVESSTYKKRGAAPGENPPGTRQPERAKARNTDGDSNRKGGYANRRGRAGSRGTVVTGGRGLGSGSSQGKTLLGK